MPHYIIEPYLYLCVCFSLPGSKQKWVPINIELPKSSHARKNWPSRRDPVPENSGTEASQGSSAAKDATSNFRRRDDRPATSRKQDLSPRKDQKDRHDVADRGGKDHGRPNSASLKSSSKKGELGISVNEIYFHPETGDVVGGFLWTL